MAKITDRNDYWFIKKNPITKVGVFDYLGSQISPECEPHRIYKVLRPKEELFKQETLDSLHLLPLINNHEMLGKDTKSGIEFTPAEDKGVEGVLGEQVSHDSDTIYSDIKIYSEDLKEQIRNGKKELSLGYFCTYDKQEGTYQGQKYDYVQRNIIGNHLALVDRGRMGADVRVYDHHINNNTGVFAMDSIAIDNDEDIEWITVRGTHIPIKNGESKEQAVKNFLEGKKEQKTETESKSEPEKKNEELSTIKKLYENSSWKKDEDIVDDLIKKGYQVYTEPVYETETGGKIKIRTQDKETLKMKNNYNLHLQRKNGKLFVTEIEDLNESKQEQSEGGERLKSAKERVLKKQFENMTPEKKEEFIDDIADSYIGTGYLGVSDKDKPLLKKLARDNFKDVFLEKKDLYDIFKEHKNNKATENEEKSYREQMFRETAEKRRKQKEENENKEPENERITFGNGNSYSGTAKEKGLMEEDIRNAEYDINYAQKKQQKEMKKLYDYMNTVSDPDELNRLERKIKDSGEKFEKEQAKKESDLKELKQHYKKFYGKNNKATDSVEIEEYKNNKESKMAQDKAQVVYDSIMELLEDKVDEETLNKVSQVLAPKAEDECSKDKNKVQEDEFEENVDPKLAKKADKEDDEEEAEEEIFGKGKKEDNKKVKKEVVETIEEDSKEDDEAKKKEELKKVKEAVDGMPEQVIKAIAKRDSLGKAVVNLVGTFDYSNMTATEVAKYACDKLDIQAEAGHEVATLDGYIKGAKRNNVTVSYKVSINGTTDKAFEKFMKGE